jgi:hypothetical protein
MMFSLPFAPYLITIVRAGRLDKSDGGITARLAAGILLTLGLIATRTGKNNED